MSPSPIVKNPVRGRLLALEKLATPNAARFRFSIQNQNGLHTFEESLKAVNQAASERPLEEALGSIVEYAPNENRLKVLTPNRSQDSVKKGILSRWMERTLDPERMRALRVRRQIEQGIREFFDSRDFLETRTPLLVPCPGMEPHIRTYQTKDGAYLPTSPEFAMKRLLVGGLERIYQLSTAFRDEPKSRTHHPEFQMLEFYRAYSGFESIMSDVEELLAFLAQKVLGRAQGDEALTFQNQKIDLKTPWPRLRVPDLFWEHAQVRLFPEPSVGELREHCKRLNIAFRAEDLWDDLYFLLWLNAVEPRLPSDRPVIVYHYPPSQAALSVVETLSDGSKWARRFEVYLGGIELGNAFEELTDAREQRARFEKDMDLREQMYGASFPKTPLDEEFLHALEEGMPPSSGIAMGVDRLVMLFADQPDLSKTIWLESYQPAEQNAP